MTAHPHDAAFAGSRHRMPPGELAFDQQAQAYDRWFDAHAPLYQSEVNALRRFMPRMGQGIEIGVGTGRFSVPFGIRLGVEPSQAMAHVARERGNAVCQAMGEQLPFGDDLFDFVLPVTVMCFVSSVRVLLQEVRRVLKPGGRILVGFIDRNSALGQVYEAHKANGKFYRVARFYSVADIADRVRQTGFGAMQFCQTIFVVLSAKKD